MWKIIAFLGVIFITIGVILAGAAQFPAQAQTITPEEKDTCYACHENLYLNYDTGRNYCLCEAPMHCTYCHGGVVGTMDEDAAHAGMVVRPEQDDAKICQSCHVDDCQEKLLMFASHANLDTTVIAETPCTTTVGMLSEIELDTVKPEPLASWKILALSIILVCLFALISFGVKCYREDCLRKTLQKS
ncbi:MAG: hypothetical protein JW908_16205 [Anaerolineales bacterium]|nr:hypothetical protein [Anaerolineales bacterium]